MLELNWSDVNRRIYARQIIKSLTYLFSVASVNLRITSVEMSPCFLETMMHYQVAEDHGFTKIADVIILV